MKMNLDLIIAALGIEKPVKEFRFHPKRRWKFDYAWPKKKIALEYEGLFSVKSRHITIKGYSDDCEKYSVAAIMGWKVIRLTPVLLHIRS